MELLVDYNILFPSDELDRKWKGTRRARAIRNWRRVASFALFNEQKELVFERIPDWPNNAGRQKINRKVSSLVKALGMRDRDFGFNLPHYNNPPVTKVDEEFKKLEFIGDAFVKAILTQYFIGKGLSRKQTNIMVDTSISNYMLGLAAKKLSLTAPNHMYNPNNETKYFGSAFEHKLGQVLTDEGYGSAYDYVVEHLIPIIDENVEIPILEDETTNR